MTEKMDDNLQEKYENSLFQILKYAKRLAILILIWQLGKKHLVVQLFANKVVERFSLTSHTGHPN